MRKPREKQGSPSFERVMPSSLKSLSNTNFTIIGLGSGGSYIAEQLVRSGANSLTLIDYDIVEPHNLSRTSYRLEHVGQKKGIALHNILREINEDIEVKVVTRMFSQVGEELKAIFDSTDIVIAATDDPRAQQQISRCAYYSSVPAVFAGLYKGAEGGEICVTIPGITPCFECMVPSRRFIQNPSSYDRDVNYGTGRLEGEIALSCDIHHLASAAVKLVVSVAMLINGEKTGKTPSILIDAIKNDFNMLLMSMVPDYFPEDVFEGVGGQLAYQSVWVSIDKCEQCTVCGENSSIENPFQYSNEPTKEELSSIIRR